MCAKSLLFNIKDGKERTNENGREYKPLQRSQAS